VYISQVALTTTTQCLLILATCDIKTGNNISKIKKMPSIAVIALAITALALTVTTAAILSTNQTVPLNGTIGNGTTDNGSIDTINLSVYSDSACTQTVTALNVGTLNPGGTASQTVYIKNSGNVPETLTMTTNNWTPTSASSSLTLTWNRQNTVLNAGASIQAILTLTAVANTGSLTTFSCDVILTGTQ
jgi:hypothetical protein